MKEPVDIDYLLSEVITLPSLPITISRITQLLNDPACSLSNVGKVIATDPAIALKTLRVVNSAYYGLASKVTSVEHAVVLLGTKVLRNLVFTATVFDTFKRGADILMRHSVACGMAMRVLIDAMRQHQEMETDPEGAFVFGLLHDVGKIILEEFLPDEVAIAQTLSRERHIPLYQAEREIIGVDHAEIGARLSEKWKLPGELISAIAGHHDLSQCRNAEIRPLAAALAVADYICVSAGIPAETGAVVIVPDEMWAACAITPRQMPPLLHKFFTSLPTVNDICQAAA